MKQTATKLSPAQQQAYDELQRVLTIGSVGLLYGGAGSGKTTILRELLGNSGGSLLTMKEYMDVMEDRHPLALEEAFESMVMHALRTHSLVIVDDLHMIDSVVGSCAPYYPRSGLLNAPLNVLATFAEESGKKLVFGNEGGAPRPVTQRCHYVGIGEFQPDDYAFFCHAYLEEKAAQLDYEKIHRFAPHLNAHQLKGACHWLKDAESLDAESFIEYLRARHLSSNVSLQEVRPVSLSDLKGIDDIIQSLEANIIVPLENDELATELDLKPKRGVLLAGPPGTGKTTIGRALAHRLKSKFFLIDGTFIAGTGGFYGSVHEVFQEAKKNAPSIIFIDDSDAIFESGEELGLYRYLLTMLDGLESQSVERVCVMMTAMNVGHLPPALIRSGRIELWLETRLPDAEARAAILRDAMKKTTSAIADFDMARVVEQAEGFTGADLQRLVEDAKNLYAYDKVRQQALKPITDYFLAAIETVRENKERYAIAEANAQRQRPSRPFYYNLPGMDGDEDE